MPRADRALRAHQLIRFHTHLTQKLPTGQRVLDRVTQDVLDAANALCGEPGQEEEGEEAWPQSWVAQSSAFQAAMNRLVEWARETKVMEEEGGEETLPVGEEDDLTGDDVTAEARDASLNYPKTLMYTHIDQDPPLPTTMERLILTADDEDTFQAPLIPPKSPSRQRTQAHPARSPLELKSPFDLDSEGRGSDSLGGQSLLRGTERGELNDLSRQSLRSGRLSLTQQPLSSRRQIPPLVFPSLRKSPPPTKRSD